MSASPTCSRCGCHAESIFHCLRDCRFSREIWEKIGFTTNHLYSSDSALQWIKEGASSSQSILFLCGLWWIWRHRNSMCLGNETASLFQLCCNIYSLKDAITTTFHSNAHTTPLTGSSAGITTTFSAQFWMSTAAAMETLSVQVMVVSLETKPETTSRHFQGISNILMTSFLQNFQLSIKDSLWRLLWTTWRWLAIRILS